MQSLLIVLLALGIASSGPAASLLRIRPARVPAGIDLLAEAPASNLNNTSAEAPPRLEAPPAEPVAPAPVPAPPAPVAEVSMPSAPAPVPAPPVSLPPPAVEVPAPRQEEPPLPPRPLPIEVETVSASAPSAIEDSQPGGSIMIHPSRPLFPVLLAAFLAAVPAAEGQTDGPKEEPNKDKVLLDKLKSIQESVDGISKQVNNLSTDTDLKIQAAQEKTNKEIGELKTKVGTLSADMEAIRKALSVPQVAAPSPTAKEMDEFRKTLDRLEASLKTVREQMGTTRVALSPPVVTEGKLTLENEYPQDIQVIVNQTPYVLRPKEKRILKLAAGTYTFSVPSVPGYDAVQTRTLKADDPRTITIYPR